MPVIEQEVYSISIAAIHRNIEPYLLFGRGVNEKKKASSYELEASIRSGSDLSSRPVTRQVLSTPKSLTTVFGMGTGVASW